MDLPEGFQKRMSTLLGADAPHFFRALEDPPRRALRWNPERVTPEALLPLLSGKIEEVPFGENGTYFSFAGVGNHPLHHSGAVYVQEPAAMAPVASLPREKVGAILDLCASPGGKSLQAASLLLKPEGTLVCNEPVPARRATLMQNLERCGEMRAIVTGFDGTHLPPEMEELFDLVICDAPCSGEGMMRKNPEAVTTWSEEKVSCCALVQAKLLESAARALAPGGRLLYSTCTWSLEENEDRIAAFLKEHSEFSLLSPREEVAACATPGFSRPECPELVRTLRFYPHIFPGEGQFLAILQKEGERTSDRKEKKQKKDKAKPNPNQALVRAFLSQVLKTPLPGEILFRGEDAYLLPSLPFPWELAVSPGLKLGCVRKGRFVPHHRLFSALGAHFKQTLSLSPEDPRVEGYLRGEEIPLSLPDGWAVICLGKSPLGGVKISQGRGKNYYPKGLRKGPECTTS